MNVKWVNYFISPPNPDKPEPNGRSQKSKSARKDAEPQRLRKERQEKKTLR
jgi:hypothetical protein